MQTTRRGLAGLAGLALPVPAMAGQALSPAPSTLVPPWALNVTESPFGPSDRAVAAIREAATDVAHYAHAPEERLIAVIAAANGVRENQVAITTGALEPLSMAALLWTRGGVQVAPALTYDTHVKYAARNGSQTRRVAMRPDQQIDLDALAAPGPDAKLVYFCNPNNPTGLLADRLALRDACMAAARLAPVLVDEAFIDMTDDPQAQSVVDLVRDGHDVTVIGTFSKSYALAGLRVGYAIGQNERIGALRSILPTSHNGPGMAAAAVSYRDRDYLMAANRAVREGREALYHICEANRLTVLPSVASYVWIDLGPDAAGVLSRLEAAGTPLRPFSEAYPTWARAAVREPAAIAALSRTLPVALRG